MVEMPDTSPKKFIGKQISNEAESAKLKKEFFLAGETWEMKPSTLVLKMTKLKDSSKIPAVYYNT